MRFVYATRPLPKLEFATANQREAIPVDAEVYAVCDGALTIRQEDKHALSSLTDQEQSALQELIAQSQMAEAATRTHSSRGKLLGRILRLLVNP